MLTPSTCSRASRARCPAAASGRTAETDSVVGGEVAGALLEREHTGGGRDPDGEQGDGVQGGHQAADGAEGAARVLGHARQVDDLGAGAGAAVTAAGRTGTQVRDDADEQQDRHEDRHGADDRDGAVGL